MEQTDLQHLVHRLYREGIRLEEAGKLYSDIADARFSRNLSRDLEDVNMQDSEVPEDVQKALTYLAAQFHYAHVSELVVSGRIIEHGKGIPLKRLGVILCLSHMAYADIWGRYLAAQGEQIARNPALERHFEVLFTESRFWNVLLGLCVIGVIAGRVVMEKTQNSVDPGYNQIASFVADAKREDEELIAMLFNRQMASISEQDRVRLQQKAELYRDHAIEVILGGHDPYQVLGISDREVAYKVGEAVNAFYQRIGLEEPIGD